MKPYYVYKHLSPKSSTGGSPRQSGDFLSHPGDVIIINWRRITQEGSGAGVEMGFGSGVEMGSGSGVAMGSGSLAAQLWHV